MFLNKTKYQFYFILLTQIIGIISFIMLCIHIREPESYKVVRYAMAASCAYMLVVSVLREHQKVTFLKFLFIGWILYLLISALGTALDGYDNYRHLKQYVTIFIVLYTIPFFMFSQPDTKFYHDSFKLFYTLTIAYIIFAIPVFLYGKVNNYGVSEAFVFVLEGAPILLMTLPYHSKSKQRMIIIGIIMAIVIMMLLGRRNKVVFFGGAFALSAVFFILNSKTSPRIKMRFIIMISLCAIGLFLYMDNFSLFFNKVSQGMSSREQVIDNFHSDFNSHPSDWIWGRGIYGEFDGGVLNNSADGLTRDGIENGYLFLILKGGMIWLVLLTLISLKSIFLGLFKSNNILCKGFAMLILLYYVDMIGFGIPDMTIKYIMVFIAIAGCNSSWLREQTDIYLKNQIGLK